MRMGRGWLSCNFTSCVNSRIGQRNIFVHMFICQEHDGVYISIFSTFQTSFIFIPSQQSSFFEIFFFCIFHSYETQSYVSYVNSLQNTRDTCASLAAFFASYQRSSPAAPAHKPISTFPPQLPTYLDSYLTWKTCTHEITKNVTDSKTYILVLKFASLPQRVTEVGS